ncbi:aci13 [Castilleja foliolosa]|uniref:Aci13 n=1 Tax=Castilleja foliolosa TaxID=1961234 RepID=A0ABD3ED40_9LAMI
MGTNPNKYAGTLLLPEIGPDGLTRESPAIAYTEKIIEEEQLQLRKYIQENYTKIRDVERELANLSMEMKLTAGPKKAALEHIRKKIEMSTEKIRVAKLKEDEAKKAWEAGAKAVHDEEAIKQKLCEDLSSLVQESSNTQLSRLEELKRRLDALNPIRSSTSVVPDRSQRLVPATIPHQDSSTVRTSEPATVATKITISEANSTAIVNGQNPQISSDGEGRGKKKSSIQGRVKGIGAVPKGRGPAGPG